MTKRSFNISVITALLACFIGFTSCEDEDNIRQLGNWIKLRSDFPGTTRGGAVCFVIDNVAYVGTGINTAKTEEKEYFKNFHSCTAVGENLVWIGASNWDLTGQGVSSMPEIDDKGNHVDARMGAVAFSLNGKGYVGLGYSGYHYLKDFWEFDPKGTPDPKNYPTIYNKMNDEEKAKFGINADGTPTGSWKKIADFPGDSCRHATAFVLRGADGKKYAYVGSGEDYDDNYINAFYKFDGENWTTSAPLGNKRSKASSFTYEIDGVEYGYVVAGQSSDGCSEWLERYNPITNEWVDLRCITNKTHESFDDDYDILCFGATAFVLYDKVYLTTGGLAGTGTKTWEYDPVSDYWVRKRDFEGFSRYLAVSFVLEHEATTPEALKYCVDGKQMVPYVTTGAAQVIGHSGSGGTFYGSTYLFNPYQAWEPLD